MHNMEERGFILLFVLCNYDSRIISRVYPDCDSTAIFLFSRSGTVTLIEGTVWQLVNAIL